MSTDNTLADVQPGGRVRLGDQAFAQGCDELRMRTDGERAAYLEGVAEGRRAALSAQPSPGGQGDALRSFACEAVEYFRNRSDVVDGDYGSSSPNEEMKLLSEGEAALAARQPDTAHAAYHTGKAIGRRAAELEAAARQPVTMDDALAAGDGTLHGAIDHWQERALRAEAELAARQPVGEPVGVTTLVHSKHFDKTQCTFMRSDVPEGTKLYVAPPAQAVDLGQFREVMSAVNARLQDVISDSMMPWSERDKASKEQAALYPLLALIDSDAKAQAVDLERFRKLATWVVNCAGHGINDSQRRMGEELLALIDGKAVGNG